MTHLKFFLTYLLIASIPPSGNSSADDLKKIVIIGDSLTEGFGVAHDAAYPALVQKKLTAAGKNWLVVNSGISGSTSASAVSRVNWSLKQHPNLVILALGGNDGLRGMPVRDLETNLTKAVTLCKGAKVKVILAGMKVPPNYGAKYTEDFAAVFPRVAQKTGVSLIPFLLENVGGKTVLNQSDGIHPNEKGHALIAETIYKAILKQL